MATTLPALRLVERIPLSTTPLIDCAWCWSVLHRGEHFPEQVSSTICPGHMTWMLAQAEQRRAQRSEVQHAR